MKNMTQYEPANKDVKLYDNNIRSNARKTEFVN